jgi:hypothetical protein
LISDKSIAVANRIRSDTSPTSSFKNSMPISSPSIRFVLLTISFPSNLFQVLPFEKAWCATSRTRRFDKRRTLAIDKTREKRGLSSSHDGGDEPHAVRRQTEVVGDVPRRVKTSRYFVFCSRIKDTKATTSCTHTHLKNTHTQFPIQQQSAPVSLNCAVPTWP